jgi:phage tail protein X
MLAAPPAVPAAVAPDVATAGELAVWSEPSMADAGAGAARDGGTADRRLMSVRVEQGDTLTHIVRRYYGHESAALMTAVRQANPETSDPDVVLAGQTAQIPAPSAATTAAGRVASDATSRLGDARTPKRRRRRPSQATAPDTATLDDDDSVDGAAEIPERDRP